MPLVDSSGPSPVPQNLASAVFFSPYVGILPQDLMASSPKFSLHFREPWLGRSPTPNALNTLKPFFNMLENGVIPASVQPRFVGAILIPIPKSSVDNFRHCPIAIGILSRIFVARLLADNLILGEDVGSYLRPLQRAVGPKYGIQCIIHALRLTCDDLADSDHVILKADLTNAFDRVERSRLLREVITHAPHITSHAQMI